MKLKEIVFMVLFLTTYSSHAEDTNNLIITGTLIYPPPCIINGGEDIDIHFGDKIGVNAVRKEELRRPINLNVRCEPGSQEWQMLLSYTGKRAVFDEDDGATIASEEQPSLGVKIYANGEPMKMDIPLKINANALSTLEAVLVQDKNESLDEGDFNAKAIFHVEYQ